MVSSDPSRKRGREEVSPPPPAEPEEVSPPMRAPFVNVEDACFSVKMLYLDWQSLKKMDYAFKVNVLAGHLEREVPPRRRRWRPRRLHLRLRL
jgi:hypothetical protein